VRHYCLFFLFLISQICAHLPAEAIDGNTTQNGGGKKNNTDDNSVLRRIVFLLPKQA